MGLRGESGSIRSPLAGEMPPTVQRKAFSLWGGGDPSGENRPGGGGLGMAGGGVGAVSNRHSSSVICGGLRQC